MPTQVLREEKPGCFGRIDDPAKGSEGWNPNSPECAGGATPTGKQEQCCFFNACGSLVQAKKMEAARQFIDPKTLVKPQQAANTSPPPVLTPQPFKPAVQAAQPQATQPNQIPTFVQRFAEQQAAQQQQQMQAQMQAQMQQQMQAQLRAMQNQAVQPQMGMAPYGYQQMMPVNYQMPSYLSNPEPNEGGFWKMFGLTVFRSMGKSMGHSVAYMFDSVPLGKRDPR